MCRAAKNISGILLVVAACFSPAAAATKVWQAEHGNWNESDHWLPCGAPLRGDSVRITNGVVFLTNSTPMLGEFVIADGAILIFSNWDTTLQADVVDIRAGATIACAGPFTNGAMSNRVSIVCSNLTVCRGGRIDANEKGYAGGSNDAVALWQGGHGPGAVALSGASHGGYAGRLATLHKNLPYDSAATPTFPGSGGRAGSQPGTHGGHGGGAVWIRAADRIVVDGSISANAGAARVFYHESGGSGGSVYLVCRELAGGGVISADGGPAAGVGVSGAGGRIAVLESLATSSHPGLSGLKVSALPGPGSPDYADLGTVYLSSGALLSALIAHLQGEVHGATSCSLPELTIGNARVRLAEDGFLLDVAGNITVVNGGLELGGANLTNDAVYWRRFSARLPQLRVGRNVKLAGTGRLSVYAVSTNDATPYGALTEDKFQALYPKVIVSNERRTVNCPLTPFQQDEHTVALYRFDEGRGNEAHSACGDPALTLRAKEALWGRRPGFGATARFTRRPDDANLFVGPVNNDKLHLRPCANAWTIEAWVRYTGPGGEDGGTTYANICGTDEEGFSLPEVRRGGWNFALWGENTLRGGIAPAARFIGSPRRDPLQDTSGHIYPNGPKWKYNSLAFISDTEWHHVAWQFRYLDQTHFLFVDGKLIQSMPLPEKAVINDADNVGVPFMVGGFLHSQNPPFYLGYGNFEGEIDELRISDILRYPVAEKLAIVRSPAPDAGLRRPYEFLLCADAAVGRAQWGIADGALPAGLSLDSDRGAIVGTPTELTEGRQVTVEASDQSGTKDRHAVTINVRAGRIVTESLPPAYAEIPYQATLQGEYSMPPIKWTVQSGALPPGIALDSAAGILSGVPTAQKQPASFAIRLQAIDANSVKLERDLALRVFPGDFYEMKADDHTVLLYNWQGPNGKLIRDMTGDTNLDITWTNMGGDRRVPWPGRAGCFPNDPGQGEHGWASFAKGNDKHNLRTCTNAWTVEAWVRRGGALCGDGKRFDFGHICGTYDTTKRGVWEFYLSDTNSPDGGMAPGVNFLGAQPDQALMDLHPWSRPAGLMCKPAEAGIRDTEWHHVAWQYSRAENLHQLFLDGRPIWRMKDPDGKQLANNRVHDAQFSVGTRLSGYALAGSGSMGFNYSGWGNFFGQIGEIRISNVRRYGDSK